MAPDTNLPRTGQPRVVIIGCGFAGLRLAQKLRKDPVQVVMVDRNNYHNFQPLLYQVATGALEPDSIAYPIRKIFAGQQNFFFRMADVTRVVPERKVVQTSSGEIAYDQLVIATGSLTNFFGMESIEQNGLQIKSIPNALNVRSFLFQNFEKALLMDDPETRQALLNVVLVGGGPTGVELAGALAEMRNHVLPKDYPELDLKQMQIYLVEAGPTLLGPMSVEAQTKSRAYLERLGVKVHTDTSIKRFENCRAYYGDGPTDYFPTENLIWAAGVNGAAVEGLPEVVVTRNKRLTVNRWNQLEGFANIFAIGDVANLVTEDTPKGYPMLAPVAQQQADQLAVNLRRLRAGEPAQPFKYFNKGVMAIVARNKAVVDLPKNISFGGFFGWITWLFVHLMTLVGFRNKVVTLADWAIQYFSADRALRLIIRPYRRNDYKDDTGKRAQEQQLSATTPPVHQPPMPQQSVVG
ncbi:MAG: NAD(P)/FAD-dependent oxidoreductase [Hymenobacteraceae bacterium]|nr:NAD(P)/FAD-dependent oxidoreductase [Hymenobacteraceae bacterium]